MSAAGRPTKYDPSYCEQARKLCRLGATDVEIADFFDVTASTVSRWKLEHPEFLEALKESKSEADARVEESLYHRAVGYTYDAVKVFQHKGEEAVIVPYREHVPPCVTAGIFWLKNRQRDKWRDKVDHEHSGKDGESIKVEVEMSDRELARRIALTLAQAS